MGRISPSKQNKSGKPEQYPDTTGLRHADARTAEGDFQAGPGTRERRGTTRQESGQGYRAAQRGGNPDRKAQVQTTPHHRMGIAEMRFVFTGNTAEQNTTIRSDLNSLNEAAGNQDPNYEPVFDGSKSSKAVAKTGIFSYDHQDVHDLNDQRMRDMGFKKTKEGLMFNGVPADQLPFEMKRALAIQMALQNDQDIDSVQRQRFLRFQEASQGESYAQMKDRALNNPQSFANDSKRPPRPRGSGPVRPVRVRLRRSLNTSGGVARFSTKVETYGEDEQEVITGGGLTTFVQEEWVPKGPADSPVRDPDALPLRGI